VTRIILDARAIELSDLTDAELHALPDKVHQALARREYAIHERYSDELNRVQKDYRRDLDDINAEWQRRAKPPSPAPAE
jgi:hypothetical protein